MHPNAALIRRFHEEQGRFYAGGPVEPLVDLLTEDVAWHVPGRSQIAGSYRGREVVLDYFRHRRDLAELTFRIHVHAVLADSERAVQLAGGTAERAGRTWEWETVGLFRIDGGRIAEGRLIPFDQYAFDEAWG